jgi:hypothetical protein
MGLIGLIGPIKINSNQIQKCHSLTVTLVLISTSPPRATDRIKELAKTTFNARTFLKSEVLAECSTLRFRT